MSKSFYNAARRVVAPFYNYWTVRFYTVATIVLFLSWWFL